jgi:hypothetical protein
VTVAPWDGGTKSPTAMRTQSYSSRDDGWLRC